MSDLFFDPATTDYVTDEQLRAVAAHAPPGSGLDDIDDLSTAQGANVSLEDLNSLNFNPSDDYVTKSAFERVKEERDELAQRPTASTLQKVNKKLQTCTRDLEKTREKLAHAEAKLSQSAGRKQKRHVSMRANFEGKGKTDAEKLKARMGAFFIQLSSRMSYYKKMNVAEEKPVYYSYNGQVYVLQAKGTKAERQKRRDKAKAAGQNLRKLGNGVYSKKFNSEHAVSRVEKQGEGYTSINYVSPQFNTANPKPQDKKQLFVFNYLKDAAPPAASSQQGTGCGHHVHQSECGRYDKEKFKLAEQKLQTYFPTRKQDDPSKKTRARPRAKAAAPTPVVAVPIAPDQKVTGTSATAKPAGDDYAVGGGGRGENGWLSQRRNAKKKHEKKKKNKTRSSHRRSRHSRGRSHKSKGKSRRKSKSKERTRR